MLPFSIVLQLTSYALPTYALPFSIVPFSIMDTDLDVVLLAAVLLPCARNADLANLKPFVKHLPNTCLFKNP